MACDQPFRATNGGAAAQDRFSDEQLLLVLFHRQENFRVADRKKILSQPDLDLRMEIEQTQRVRDCGAASTNLRRNIFLGHPKFPRQPRVSLRFFDWVEISALEILNERNLEDFEIAYAPNNHRHFIKSKLLGCAPAAFPSDQLVALV